MLSCSFDEHWRLYGLGIWVFTTILIQHLFLKFLQKAAFSHSNIWLVCNVHLWVCSLDWFRLIWWLRYLNQIPFTKNHKTQLNYQGSIWWPCIPSYSHLPLLRFGV
jgi:hypothetical protein